jgi:hypothetical protein
VSDDSVHAALRSDATLVVVEAPGGCGKTYQGAAYARDIADSISPGRLLILTHTHAACSVFHGRTRGLGSHVEIRTIDSLVSQLTDAYHAGIGLPPDTATWARHNANGYDHLAVKAAALLDRYPPIAACLARRYPVVICDEHQDSNGERHAIVMSLHDQGARLRIFADPMQKVFPLREYAGGCAQLDWTALTHAAHAFEQLDVPHRWSDGCRLLGRWILDARTTLKNGGKVDVRAGLPPSVSIVFADNNAQKNLEYRPVPAHRGPIDAFERTSDSLLILARHNDTTFGLRPTFTRRIPLWEGHVRSDLETFVDALKDGHGNRNAVAKAVVGFVQATTTGFNAASYANIFQEDVADGCAKTRRQRPAKVQALARLIVDEPNHVGASKVVARIAELRAADADFRPIQLDCYREFHEAARLGTFETAEVGFHEISRHRTYSRPQPPDKAISTIHKAKGLECKNVIIMPCDAKSFPDNQISRCLLYVAMSRASSRLMLVIPPASPSPLLIV